MRTLLIHLLNLTDSDLEANQPTVVSAMGSQHTILANAANKSFLGEFEKANPPEIFKGSRDNAEKNHLQPRYWQGTWYFKRSS